MEQGGRETTAATGRKAWAPQVLLRYEQREYPRVSAVAAAADSWNDAEIRTGVTARWATGQSSFGGSVISCYAVGRWESAPGGEFGRQQRCEDFRHRGRGCMRWLTEVPDTPV